MRIIGVLILFLIFSGCARFQIHRTSKPQPIAETHESVFHTVAFGFQPLSPPQSLQGMCKENWEEITTEVKFTRGLLHFITLNIYAPWNVTVACSPPKPKSKDFFSN